MSDDNEETQIIPPTPSQPDKSKVPLPSKSEEETQVISPVADTRLMPPAHPSSDDAPTKVGIKFVRPEANSEETQVISPLPNESDNPAETTMYLGRVGDDGDDEKAETKATPEDFGYVDYDSDISYNDSDMDTYDFSSDFPSSTQAPFIPSPGISNVYGQEAAYTAPKKKKGREKSGKKGKGGWIALIIILGILICLGFGGWWWWSTDRRQRALEACQQVQTQLNNASDNARQVIANAQSELDSLVYSQSGSDLVSALQSEIDTVLPVAVSCPVSASAALLNSNTQAMNQDVAQINSLISKTKSNLQALKTSQASAALQKAKSSLSQAISAAQQALAQNNGAVANSATITALQKALTQAKSVEQDSSSTASQMATAQTSLQEAIEKVTISAQQYEQKKLESLKQLQKEVQQTGGSAAASASSQSSPSTGAGKTATGTSNAKNLKSASFAASSTQSQTAKKQ